MTYLDTSALIKRFVREPGSEVVAKLLEGRAPVATAKIAFAEVYSGLTRRFREGGLSGRAYALVCRQFERDWPGYLRVELHDEILVSARDLIRRHPLRAYDAIHLASALSLRKMLGEEVTFAASDERLLRAATSARLTTLNVELNRP
jgi:predicted nucleic acid-binding protein